MIKTVKLETRTAHRRGAKKNKTVLKLETGTATLGIGTAEEFFERSKVRAEKLDRGEQLVPEIRVTFEDPPICCECFP